MKVIYNREGIPVVATVKEILADDQDHLRYMIQYESDGCMEIRDYQDPMQHLIKMNTDGKTYRAFEEVFNHKR